MTSPFERRLSKAEAASAAGTEARIIHVATPELAEGLWAAAISQGRPPGLFTVLPGQTPAVIVGPTLTDLMASIAEHGRTVFDKDQPPRRDDGSYLWRAPRGSKGMQSNEHLR